MQIPLCIPQNLFRVTGVVLRGAAPNPVAEGLERAPAKESAPRTVVDVETPLIREVKIDDVYGKRVREGYAFTYA